ncbi:mannose-1-phosphate guanylyltransferase/mannose-6-phosphate isomerase [bacterium]|nr:mannose-1-phosphate guanylyltransferase/mannose-6-phosphate isomerase [bacterium]
MQLIPVVLCGGSGSRLWPISREQHPKPFIRLADGQSLLQKAFLLGASLPDVTEILAVTNRDFFFKIKDEMDEVNLQQIATSFVIEPVARNTAAAVACAALQIAKMHGDDTLMLVLAADHVIGHQAAFQAAILEAIPLAMQAQLVTFGISPDSPNTGYGYIEADGNRVLRFIEKPNLEKAQDYLASGRFLWNSGMFLFTAGAILRAMDQYCPDVLAATQMCVDHSSCVQGLRRTELELNSQHFSVVPNISIDCAVMEKSDQVAVVACDIDWSDVGSWCALEQFIEPDAQGNRVEGEVLFHDVSNCYVNSKERLVGAVGVDNLLIIDTPDALLVADRSRDQDVKHLYTALKAQGHDAHRLHRTVHRPWGTYTILEESIHFKIKRLVVKPGACLSLQLHHHRSEHWVVVSGIAKVHNDNEEFFVRINESTYIKAGCKHRLENPGSLDLIMIEVQTGDYLGEDDIVRFDDVYGRV